MSVSAKCPACGGLVVFQVNTSLVTVCPYCRSVVGRGDRGIESLGKVADLVQTDSPLDVGLKGRFDNVPFTLTGRTQFSHPAGGVWDEWYAAFANGKWGWLAEAQGRFYMTFEKPVPEGLPGYDRLQLGQSVEVEGIPLRVAEKNRGKTAGAVGEMPYRVTPGQEMPFADLSGPKGEFATVDYTEGKPSIYVGRQVTLDELNIPHTKRRRYPGQEPTVQSVHLSCPNCGGALELRAPDKSERVGCPSCGSLLDVKEGKLLLLKSLDPSPVQPLIPLGSVGKFQNVDWTAIGFMQRFVTFEGVDYYWQEYLLYQPRLGFRWLTRSDGHWSWVEAVPPASVQMTGGYASYAGRSFKLFQRAQAKVHFVVGEFYWKVEAGEEVESYDYVAAPEMLSAEITRSGDEGEVNWSHGLYLQPEDVQKMFGLKESLPLPTGIGPNQPFPHSKVYPISAMLLALALLLLIFFVVIASRRVVYQENYTLPADARSRTVLVDQPLALKGHQNVEVELAVRGTPWMHIEGKLTPADPAPTPGGATRSANTESREFAFAGLDGQKPKVYLSSVPKGEYRLQFTLTSQNPAPAASADLKMRQGVPHSGPFVFLLLSIGAVPLAVGVYQLLWESRRWAESNP